MKVEVTLIESTFKTFECVIHDEDIFSAIDWWLLFSTKTENFGMAVPISSCHRKHSTETCWPILFCLNIAPAQSKVCSYINNDVLATLLRVTSVIPT